MATGGRCSEGSLGMRTAQSHCEQTITDICPEDDDIRALVLDCATTGCIGRPI